ncbi:hypothetical protein [Brasilonema bromeliae]|uniref:hypothetical protein n=1 Tax=Brasilonema bromeliae TaxID=383615 RepID=UPI003BB529AC
MSTLAVINPAHAAKTEELIHKNGQTCVLSPHAVNKMVCIKDSERKKASGSTPSSSTPSSTVTTGSLPRILQRLHLQKKKAIVPFSYLAVTVQLV